MSTQQDIQQAADAHYLSRFDEEQRELVRIVDEGDRAEYNEALEELQEQPLSVEKVATYHRTGTTEWEILLSTGGPAERIVVRTDSLDMIEHAEYQFQDWFQPWTPASNQDHELVQRYAAIVGYYEAE